MLNVEIFLNCYPSVVFAVLILLLLIYFDAHFFNPKGPRPYLEILRNLILLPIRGGVIED